MSFLERNASTFPRHLFWAATFYRLAGEEGKAADPLVTLRRSGQGRPSSMGPREIPQEGPYRSEPAVQGEGVRSP